MRRRGRRRERKMGSVREEARERQYKKVLCGFASPCSQIMNLLL